MALRFRRSILAISVIIVLREAVDCLSLVGEHRYATRRRKALQQINQQIGAHAYDVLRFIDHQVFNAGEVLKDTFVLTNQLSYPRDVLFIGALQRSVGIET